MWVVTYNIKFKVWHCLQFVTNQHVSIMKWEYVWNLGNLHVQIYTCLLMCFKQPIIIQSLQLIWVSWNLYIVVNSYCIFYVYC